MGPKPTETQIVGPANYANATRTDSPTAEATAPARGTPQIQVHKAHMGDGDGTRAWDPGLVD